MLQWIVSALWGAYLSSNVLKWYWWRFNGHGYFWGMVAGIVPALIAPTIWPEVLPLYYFPHLMGISLVGCILGTYLTKPTDEETLKTFYRTVRPWGFWGPIRRKVEAEDPDFKRNTNFKRDMVNVVVGHRLADGAGGAADLLRAHAVDAGGDRGSDRGRDDDLPQEELVRQARG